MNEYEWNPALLVIYQFCERSDEKIKWYAIVNNMLEGIYLSVELGKAINVAHVQNLGEQTRKFRFGTNVDEITEPGIYRLVKKRWEKE